MLVTLDGESKAGKTTFVDAIAGEAEYQAAAYASALTPDSELANLSGPFQEIMETWVDTMVFDGIHRVTAGNAFRAAAFYVVEKEKVGITKTGFEETDTNTLRSLLAEEGVRDMLQTDPTIERRVSSVAQMTGARALCETIFCDEVIEAYRRDGGANLVIADARNPVELMRRNRIIGESESHVYPGSILPCFIDTPLEIAVARKKDGDYEDNLAYITKRRNDDTTRPEYPFVRPAKLMTNMRSWLCQFPCPETADGIAVPFHIMNDETLPFETIQFVASCIATASHDLSAYLHVSRQPGYQPPKFDEAVLRILASNAL